MLAFLGQNDLGIYLAINVVAYLSITLLYVYFNPRARRALNSVAAVLFTGFVVIVILEIMDIVSGR
jgi:TRAP-type C4-dicarboxylate transport system permease small subunit